MTAKDKAIELVDKMAGFTIDDCKRNATTCVDEILKNIDATIFYHKESKALPINKQFWEQVKEEIQLIN